MLLLAGDIQCRSAFPTAARVSTGAKQQLEALGVALLGGNINRRNAVLVALVDVAARSQQQLEALGVAFVGGNVNRRPAVVVALVDVAARPGRFIGQMGEPKRLLYNMPICVLLNIKIIRVKRGEWE